MTGHNQVIFKWVVTLATSLPCVMLRAGEESWTALSPLPEPNGGFIGLAEPDAVVVVGGTNWVDGSKRWLRTVHRLDLSSLSWTTLAPLGQPLA